jgi:S1-C subfamily serine protease
MGLPGPGRQRVSRETRLLLATILLSIAALWALARLRFPERPVTTSPVQPLLTQLTPPPAFDDLAGEIAKLESRLRPSLVNAESAVALRVRGDRAVMYVPPTSPATTSMVSSKITSRDEASSLAAVAVADGPVTAVVPWSPNELDRSRYVIATGASASDVFLRPVFVGHLQPVADLAWQSDIWMIPPRTDVSPGDFLFMTDGTLLGLVVARAGSLAVVPGETLLGAVDALLQRTASAPGWVGVEIDTLPAPAVSGPEAAGVVVAWVDPEGPAAEKLSILDVVEAIGDDRVASPADWRARLSRIAPGASIVLRVRRGDERRQVTLVTAAPPALEATLGLRMRTVRRRGAEVLEVANSSAAARAGFREGDLIVAAGEIQAPTAAQVETSFAELPSGRSLLVAVARGNRHHILALEKR